MNTKKQTHTATVRDMRSLTNAAEKHAAVAEAAADRARIHADAAREQHAQTKAHTQSANIAATCAHQSANRASDAAEDAEAYARATRYCLMASMLTLAAALIISLF